MTGVDTYYGVGNSDAYGGSRVTLWLDLTKGISSGQMEMHVINPNPDGCNFTTIHLFIQVLLW